MAIAFDNDPEILGAMTAILLMGIVITGVIGAWLGKDDAGAEASGDITPAEAEA